MELSVIIVSFNVKEYLKNCLSSVKAASELLDCEIIVVDNNSQDGSVEMLNKDFSGIKLISNHINSGFSAANNMGIKISRGQFILLLNPDTLVEQDTFLRCVEFMKLHPDAGAVGIKMINGEGRYLPESKRAFPSPLTAFFKTSGISSLFPQSGLLNKYYLPQIDIMRTSLTEVISGAFMFIRREAITKSGLLDEDFFMYGEDIDLSYRLLQTGYLNYYFPEASIIHFKGKCTSRDNFKDILFFYRAMRIYVLKRSSEGLYKPFTILIMSAIYLREFLALFNRGFRLIFIR